MAAARDALEIKSGDDLECEFNQRYIECKALSSFSSNDVQQDKERLVKIRICESAHSTRFGLTNIECLIPIHRVRLGSATAVSTTSSQTEQVCSHAQSKDVNEMVKAVSPPVVRCVGVAQQRRALLNASFGADITTVILM